MLRKMARKNRIITLSILLLCFFTVILVISGNHKVTRNASESIFDEVDAVPFNRTALILGTSPTLNNGEDNMYFVYRIQAAADLYSAGKVEYFVVSGDNGKETYNEPEAMKNALLASGIPESAIYLDYAGFRTLDSVVRMNTIFGQESFTVVSQKFHNERAIYLAKVNGLSAIGYNAKDVTKFYGIKTRIREYFARVKMFMDIIVGKKPHFGGDPITIGE